MRRIRLVLEYRLSKGISAEQTALALSIAKGSVLNIQRRFEQSGLPWPLPDTLSDTALEEKLFPPCTREATETASVPLPDIHYIERELARKHVTLQRLWEEYHEMHPRGLQRSAYYEFVAKQRPPAITMKMTHKGGDKLFVDYSGEGLEYIDRSTGEIVPIELFVCAWGASSYSYAEGTVSQKTRDFTQSHVRAFTYFGVVPFALVPDNLKSGVQKSDRYDPVINPMYGAMARHYNVVVLPARVKKPQDKAVVESSVLHIQRFILARLRNRQFFSLDEVNAAIRAELEAFNCRPMKEYGGQSRKERFELLDKPAAQPLPADAFKVSGIKSGVLVAPNYHIRFEDHFYSVPHQMVGKRVDVYQLGAILEIYHDNVHVCRHRFAPPDFQYSTTKEHMPPSHAFVKGWSKEWFLAKAAEIGPSCAGMVMHIMRAKEHAEQGFNAAMGVLRLAKMYPRERLERACQRALYFKSYSVHAIKAILEQHLDKQVFLPLSSAPVPEPLMHENIRGAKYYASNQQ